MYTVDTESVEYAFDHLMNVAQIHADNDSMAEIASALKLVHQGLGMTEEATDAVFTGIAKMSPELDKASWMVLGVIIGLAAAQHGAESE